MFITVGFSSSVFKVLFPRAFSFCVCFHFILWIPPPLTLPAAVWEKAVLLPARCLSLAQNLSTNADARIVYIEARTGHMLLPLQHAHKESQSDSWQQQHLKPPLRSFIFISLKRNIFKILHNATRLYIENTGLTQQSFSFTITQVLGIVCGREACGSSSSRSAHKHSPQWCRTNKMWLSGTALMGNWGTLQE